MSLLELSNEGVWTEIYRRAVRAYGHSRSSWTDCLSGAITSVQIEMDTWLLTTKIA